MAYTAPRTYTTAELITAAILNLDVRDNLTWFGVTHDHSGDTGDGGAIATVPTNLIAHTTAASARSGWAIYTALYGRVIVGFNTNIGSTVATALTTLEDRTHTHTGPSHTHKTGIDVGYSASSQIAYGNNTYGISGTLTATGIAGGISSGTISNSLTSADGTGATGATSATMPYINLLPIQKS